MEKIIILQANVFFSITTATLFKNTKKNQVSNQWKLNISLGKDKFQTITTLFIILQEAKYHKSKCNYEFYEYAAWGNKILSLGKESF
jgi:hypothetical protein